VSSVASLSQFFRKILNRISAFSHVITHCGMSATVGTKMDKIAFIFLSRSVRLLFRCEVENIETLVVRCKCRPFCAHVESFLAPTQSFCSETAPTCFLSYAIDCSSLLDARNSNSVLEHGNFLKTDIL